MWYYTGVCARVCVCVCVCVLLSWTIAYFSWRGERSAEPWTWPYGRWPWAFILESIPPFRLFRVELPRAQDQYGCFILNRVKWRKKNDLNKSIAHVSMKWSVVNAPCNDSVQRSHGYLSPHGNSLCLAFSQQLRCLRCNWASHVRGFCSLFCLST